MSSKRKATRYQLFSSFILEFDQTNRNLKTFFHFFSSGKAKNLPSLGRETKIKLGMALYSPDRESADETGKEERKGGKREEGRRKEGKKEEKN